jgi:phosphohistidine swiveling domain-containing protein
LFAPKHCAYGENPPKIDDYFKKFKDVVLSSIKPVSSELAKNEVLDQLSESMSILDNINDSKLTILCKLVAQIGVFRDQNKAKLGETVVRRIAILDEISKRACVNRSDLDLYLVSEIVELISTSRSVENSVIDQRRSKGVVFTRNEDVSVGVIKLRNYYEKITNLKTIAGTCASPGFLKGKAKIIKSKEDISKINKSDIMVAIGTDFDLLEIMHLSAGIITEEGGLLSHASVVCRELKKPCLIGVKHATDIIKDGQKITLNATEGKIVVQ